MPTVGTGAPRRDGTEKVTGNALYTDDISMPQMWYGTVVRSNVPHGRIKKIELDPNFNWSQVVTASAQNIPGKNVVTMIEEDLPLIASDITRHIGEAILLIAAPTLSLAKEAHRHVILDIEELEPILSIEDSRSARIKIRHNDNIVADYTMSCGDLEEGFANADQIIEAHYSMGHQEHMYIEPNGIIATPRTDGFDVIGSIQCPYYVSKALSILMDRPEEDFSVRQAVIGGAFGGKEDYPSILAGYSVVLANKCKHPVKIIYERAEDTEVTTKRHPAIVKHRTGVKKDGTLTAMDIRIEMDAGAYVTLTPVVLSRGLLHSTGPYRCPNVYAHATAWATNTPPNGAFRGFGAPQTIFPIEAHIDSIADAIGIDPLELRRKNCLKLGDTTATGQLLRESVTALECLDKAALKSNFVQRRAELSKKNQDSRVKRGIGLSLFWHGAGFTGSGEAKIKGKAGLRLDPDGSISVLTACTDMGQGAHTVLPQMAADYLGVGLSCIGIETPDTSLVPNSGPTVASRTTMVMGVVLGKCAAGLKEKLFDFASAKMNIKKEKLRFNGTDLFEDNSRLMSVAELVKAYLESKGPLTITEHYELPPGIVWDDTTYKGDAYPAFAWGCDVAEIEIDIDTLEVKVLKMWMAQDIGRAINPKMAAGQIEGGTLQSVGYALMEKHVLDHGHFKTNRFQNYIIPTSLDSFEMDTIIIENPFSFGPMGAKGLGEMPIDGGAPAIANAIANAIGIHMRDLPMTPEKIYEAWVGNISRLL